MSNINPTSIDGTFPVAGQDNSSQGFRTNFTNIVNNFTYAYSEITDLQNKAILISALNGQTLNNDMAGAILRRPQLQSWTQTIYNLQYEAGNVTLDFNVANFQQITTNGPITLNFINWPSTTGATGTGYGLMRVWFNVISTAHTVTVPASVTTGVADIAGYNAGTCAITFDAPGYYAFDFSSFDGGVTYIMSDVTRNRNSLRDPNIYYNPAITTAPTLFVGYGQNGGGQTALSAAIAGDQGQNIVSVFGSYNSVAIGNLTSANVTNATIDTGKISGYSITSARGNLALGNVQPLQNNDYLGYYNAVGFTGNGAGGNTFQQMSSIVFYANGTNPAAGLGGNIALFTAIPNDGGSQNVVQAVGIENNQSVKFFGNAEVSGIFKTDGTIVEGGTYANTMVTTGGVYNQFVANSAISTLIVDSSASAAIPLANIVLPSNPVDRQKFKIVAAAPITSANVYAPNSAAIKWVTPTVFSAGNVSVQLTYLAGYGTWYRS